MKVSAILLTNLLVQSPGSSRLSRAFKGSFMRRENASTPTTPSANTTRRLIGMGWWRRIVGNKATRILIALAASAQRLAALVALMVFHQAAAKTMPRTANNAVRSRLRRDGNAV